MPEGITTPGYAEAQSASKIWRAAQQHYIKHPSGEPMYMNGDYMLPITAVKKHFPRWNGGPVTFKEGYKIPNDKPDGHTGDVMFRSGGKVRRKRCKSCGRLPKRGGAIRDGVSEMNVHSGPLPYATPSTGYRTLRGGASMKHPGFKAEAVKIARREGVPLKSADAILASSSRRASTAAHRANPKLNRVGGKLGLKLGTWEI